ELEAKQQEPEGQDRDLISQLERMVVDGPAAAKPAAPVPAAPAAPTQAVGTLVHQVLERPLRVGEVPLDELERAFRETAPEIAPVEMQAKPALAAPAPAKSAAAKSAPAKAAREPSRAEKDDDGEKGDAKVANQSIRVNVETLEHLMTMVSELVLTR